MYTEKTDVCGIFFPMDQGPHADMHSSSLSYETTDPSLHMAQTGEMSLKRQGLYSIWYSDHSIITLWLLVLSDIGGGRGEEDQYIHINHCLSTAVP